ncbi:MAG: PH domain-containing protein [Bowdeniella nasicola]|nr:PH domain-containing protein [Bowdeniella nasicola]
MTKARGSYRVFRPLFAPIVAAGLLAAVVVGYAVLLWRVRAHPSWGSWDRITVGLFLAAGLIVVVRQALICARPSEEGLDVRNLFRRRQVQWAEIIAVRYAPGWPWVRLDLSDGTTLAVMAIQAADGRRAEREAARLAALVRAHEPPDFPPLEEGSGPST